MLNAYVPLLFTLNQLFSIEVKYTYQVVLIIIINIIKDIYNSFA